MPFKSRSQQGYMFAHHPEIAKEFASNMTPKDFKKLPIHAAEGGEINDPLLNDFTPLQEGDRHFLIRRDSTGQEAALPKDWFSQDHQDEIRNHLNDMNFEPDASMKTSMANMPSAETSAMPAAPIETPPETPPNTTPSGTPPPGTPSPPMMPDAMAGLEKSYQQQQAGIQGMAKAQSQGYKLQADLEQKRADEIKATAAKFADEKLKLDTEQAEIQKKVADGKIDPNHFWDTKTGIKGGAQRVLSLIGLFLGGAAQMKTGHNPAQEMLEKAMNDDIDAQKAEMGKNQNLLSENFKKYGTLQQAEMATRMDMANIFDAQIKRVAAQTNSDAVKSQAAMMSGQLSQNHEIMKNALVTQNIMKQAMGNANGVPDALLPMLPKEQAGLMVRVGPNKNVPARSEKDAQDLRDAEPVINHAVSMIDEMIAGLRGYKEVQTPQGIQKVPVPTTEKQLLPEFWGMGHLTPAGRAGKSAQTNVETALKDVGKTQMRLNEYTDENFLQSRIPNPAQYSTQESIQHLLNTKKELLGRAEMARNAKLQQYNSAPLSSVIKPGLAR